MRMHQNTTAVNSDDIAYTSPSTAENQNVSVYAKANEPTKPLPIIEMAWNVDISALLLFVPF